MMSERQIPVYLLTTLAFPYFQGFAVRPAEEDCDLANEWWDKFCALSDEKLEKAKSIISLNKFKEEDYECTDPEILEILSYYRITRDIAEGNN